MVELATQMQTTITKTSVDRLQPNSILWDSRVKGFGARRQRSDAVNYVLKHQGRWFTIGRHGSPWTCEAARTEALRLLGQLVSGNDPRPAATETFGSIVERYLAQAVRRLRPRSLVETTRHLRDHCRPLHKLELTEITRRQIAELLSRI